MNDENLLGVTAHRVRHFVHQSAVVPPVAVRPVLLTGCTVRVVGLAGIGMDDKCPAT